MRQAELQRQALEKLTDEERAALKLWGMFE